MPLADVQFDIVTLIGILGAAQALVVGAALSTTRGLQTRAVGFVPANPGVVMGVILYSHSHPGRQPIAAGFVIIALTCVAVHHSRVFLAGARTVGPDRPPLMVVDGGETASVKYGSSSLSSKESEKGFARFHRSMDVDRSFAGPSGASRRLQPPRGARPPSPQHA